MAISLPASHHQHHRPHFSDLVPAVQHTGCLIAQSRTLPMSDLSARRRGRTTGIWITAATRHMAIDGVWKELNAVASQNMDYAPARRLVRSAFLNVQKYLDHFLFKMALSGIQTEEGYDINSRGVEIFWKSWLPSPGVATKAALFFCHGYGDTCTFFFEGIAKRVAAAGSGVYAMDYPGFGLSQTQL